MKSRKMFILSVVVLLVAAATTVVSAAQFDLGGKTVTIISNTDVFASEDMQVRQAEVEAEFNCKLVGLPVAMAEAAEVITARVMAGDSTYDVYIMNSRGYFPLVANNILLPIGELLGEEYYENCRHWRANIESPAFTAACMGSASRAALEASVLLPGTRTCSEKACPISTKSKSGEWPTTR